jgi:hypothetical protein
MIDFNLPITYQIAGSSTLNINSIGASEVTTAGPRSGYKVMSAVFGETPAVGYVDKRALHDGVDAGDAYLTTKSLGIVCGVFGSSIGDFHDKLQALMDAMRPIPREYQENDGFRSLAFSQATIDTTNFSTGYIPMLMSVRPVAVPQVQLQSMHSIENIATVGAPSRGFATNVQLTFVAKKPYKFRQTSRSIEITSSSATTSLPNLGSAIVYPNFELIYSVASTYASATVSSVTFTFDGSSLKLNSLAFPAKTATSETRWFIDFDTQAVYSGVSTSGGPFVKTLRQDVVDTTTYLFGSIPPTDDSSTSLYTTYTGTKIPAQLNVTYTEAWY